MPQKQLDPSSDNFLKDIENLALNELGRHLDSLDLSDLRLHEIEKESGRLPDGSLFVRVSGAVPPLAAMASPALGPIGKSLAARETWLRMRKACERRKLETPENHPTFEKNWEELAMRVKPSVFAEMAKEVFSRPLSLKFRASLTIAVNPALPAAEQADIKFSYTVDSPCLLETENRSGRMLPFAKWLKSLGF